MLLKYVTSLKIISKQKKKIKFSKIKRQLNIADRLKSIKKFKAENLKTFMFENSPYFDFKFFLSLKKKSKILLKGKIPELKDLILNNKLSQSNGWKKYWKFVNCILLKKYFNYKIINNIQYMNNTRSKYYTKSILISSNLFNYSLIKNSSKVKNFRTRNLILRKKKSKKKKYKKKTELKKINFSSHKKRKGPKINSKKYNYNITLKFSGLINFIKYIKFSSILNNKLTLKMYFEGLMLLFKNNKTIKEEKILDVITWNFGLNLNLYKKGADLQKKESLIKESSCGRVNSAIEGIVFINQNDSNENTPIFIGEVIEFSKVTKKGDIEYTNFLFLGMVLSLSVKSAEVMVFGDTSKISPGDWWQGTTEIININCGPEYLGRVVDCVGNTLDGFQPLGQTYNIFAKVPGVCARERVGQALFTGLLSVDSLIPIGKGQRELIIGDRKIGKTSIAIESIINQQYTLCEVCSGFSGTYCFYVAIGQKLSSIRRIIYRLKKKKL